jgi:hypothetical protein
MTKDLFKAAGFKYLGPGGIKCSCCSGGFSNAEHRKSSKGSKCAFSKIRRLALKRSLYKELKYQ